MATTKKITWTSHVNNADSDPFRIWVRVHAGCRIEAFGETSDPQDAPPDGVGRSITAQITSSGSISGHVNKTAPGDHDVLANRIAVELGSAVRRLTKKAAATRTMNDREAEAFETHGRG